MLHAVKHAVLKYTNASLEVIGIEVVHKARVSDDTREFLPFETTIAGAKDVGLALGDYIDAKYNVPGATQDTHNRLTALGVMQGRIDRVCEIGPGSGRYLEKTLQTCKPSHYEIYETAHKWADWLVKTYNVISQPTDGRTLSHTLSNSIDLVQAHKVFVCTPFLTTCRYLQEISRVTRDDAWVVFDIVTEDCMDGATLESWFKTDINFPTYPVVTPKQYVIDFLRRHGFAFIASFQVAMEPGKTECMVFRK